MAIYGKAKDEKKVQPHAPSFLVPSAPQENHPILCSCTLPLQRIHEAKKKKKAK